MCLAIRRIEFSAATKNQLRNESFIFTKTLQYGTININIITIKVCARHRRWIKKPSPTTTTTTWFCWLCWYVCMRSSKLTTELFFSRRLRRLYFRFIVVGFCAKVCNVCMWSIIISFAGYSTCFFFLQFSAWVFFFLFFFSFHFQKWDQNGLIHTSHNAYEMAIELSWHCCRLPLVVDRWMTIKRWWWWWWWFVWYFLFTWRARQTRCDRQYNDERYMEITQFTIIMGNSVVFECCVTLLKYLTASPATLESFYLNLPPYPPPLPPSPRSTVAVPASSSSLGNVPFVIYFSVCRVGPFRNRSHPFVLARSNAGRISEDEWKQWRKKYACESWMLAAAAMAAAKQFSSHKS